MLLEKIRNTKSYPNMKEQIQIMQENKKEIFIFGGLGSMSIGGVTAQYFLKHQIDFKGFIVNQAYMTTNIHFNKPVYAIESYQGNKDVNIVVGISNFFEAKQVLKQYGFHHLFFFDSFIETSLETITMQDFLNLQSGFEKTYYQLSDELSRQTMIAYIQGKIFNNFSFLSKTYIGGGGIL